MRSLMIAAAVIATSACTTTLDRQMAESQRSNAAQATADAVALPTSPEGREAQCVVFLGISRDRRDNSVGFDDAAMARAQNQWRTLVIRAEGEDGANQLIGSSVNVLLPAAPAARDAASRWCVENAPNVEPTPVR